MLRIPYAYLYPLIIMFCIIGVYEVNNSIVDVWIMLIMGVLGYALRKFDFDPAPLVLGLVIAPILEQSLRQSLIMSNGNYLIFFHRPISLGLLIVSGGLLLLSAYRLPAQARGLARQARRGRSRRAERLTPPASAAGLEGSGSGPKELVPRLGRSFLPPGREPRRAMREQTDRTYPIQEDMTFQRRSWIVERVCWGLLGLLVCLALLGLFSHGPLSERRLATPDSSVTVRYERFQRITRLARFTMTLPATGEPTARLRLGPSFQDTYEIASLQPAPQSSSAGPEGLELTFAAPRAGGLTVAIWAHPHRAGLVPMSVAAGDKRRSRVFDLHLPLRRTEIRSSRPSSFTRSSGRLSASPAAAPLRRPRPSTSSCSC